MNRAALLALVLLAPPGPPGAVTDSDARERRREAIVRMNEAVEAFTSRDPGPTIEALGGAIALDPSYAGPYLNLGRIHAQAGELDEAERALGRALELIEGERASFDPDPLRGEILHDLGRLQLAKAETAGSGAERRAALREAANAFERAIQPGPGSARPRWAYLAEHQRGLALDSLGDAVAASRSYRACIAIQPDFAPCWIDLARVYLDFGEAGAATTLLERATEALPDDATLWLALAELHLDLGRPQAAIDAATKAKAADAERVGADYVLGIAEATLGRREQATEHLRRFMGRQRDEPELRVRLATDTLMRLMSE